MAEYKDIMDVPDSELPEPLPLPGEKPVMDANAQARAAPVPAYEATPVPPVSFADGQTMAEAKAMGFGGDGGNMDETLDRIALTLERIEEMLAKAIL